MSVADPKPSEDATAAGPAVGELLDDRYRVVDTLGAGGVGVVYRAERVKLGLPVAVKLLHESSAADAEIRARFEREARAMATLSHPNIVSLTDFGIWRERPYIVVELLEGKTLQRRLREGPLPIDELQHIAIQFLQGLAYAHSEGLVHRDLKPENLFLQDVPDQLPHVKILDFGFAKFMSGDAREAQRDLTREGVVFGTPCYMSPEQAVGDPMDARTDVYASGVILYEMLTGGRPFDGDFPTVTRKKLTEEVPPLLERAPDLRCTPELEQLVMSALGRDKGERPADGADLLARFKALPEPPAVRVTPGAPEPRVPAWRTALEWARKRPLPAAGAALLVLLFVWLSIPAAPEPEEAADGDDVQPEQMVISLDEAEAVSSPARTAARDPFRGGSKLPLRMQRIRQRALRGEVLGNADIKYLRAEARTRRDDPRPSLLLAYAYANRTWLTDAIQRYRLAYRVDPAVRGDERMLRDLVDFVRIRKVRKAAQQTVEAIYGVEAVKELDRVLGIGRLDGDERAALEGLRSRLTKRAARP